MEVAVFIKELPLNPVWNKLAPQNISNDERGAFATGLKTQLKIWPIRDALRAIRCLRHGGALVIVPESLDFQDKVEIPHPFEQRNNGSQAFKELDELHQSWRHDQWYYQYTEFARHVGELG